MGIDISRQYSAYGPCRVWRGNLYPVFAAGGKNTVEAREVNPRLWNQRSRPGQKIQRLEDHMGGTIPTGCFEFIAYSPIIQQRQAFLGDCRTRNIHRHSRSSLSRWCASAITPARKLNPATLATRLDAFFDSSTGGKLCKVNTLRPWWGPIAIRQVIECPYSCCIASSSEASNIR